MTDFFLFLYSCLHLVYFLSRIKFCIRFSSYLSHISGDHNTVPHRPPPSGSRINQGPQMAFGNLSLHMSWELTSHSCSQSVNEYGEILRPTSSWKPKTSLIATLAWRNHIGFAKLNLSRTAGQSRECLSIIFSIFFSPVSDLYEIRWLSKPFPAAQPYLVPTLFSFTKAYLL